MNAAVRQFLFYACIHKKHMDKVFSRHNSDLFSSIGTLLTVKPVYKLIR